MKKILIISSIFSCFVLSISLSSCGGGSKGGISTNQNPTYTVKYNGNGNTGGSVPIDPSAYEQGQTVSVLDNTGKLQKTGYYFSGWNSQANGSGAAYSAAQTFTMGAANVTLYAMWIANPTYTVTYNGNGNTGGNVPTDSTGYEQGQTVTVLGNTGNLTKTGYSFSGWNTQADGSGATYLQSMTFLMGAEKVTLYALWTESGGVITTHSVVLTWSQNRETGVNSAGGGYQVSISGQPTIIVPFVSGSSAPTSTTTSLQTGSYTVSVRAYAALDSRGGSSGTLSEPSQSIAVIVP